MNKAHLGKLKFNYPTSPDEVTVGAYLRCIDAVRAFNPDTPFHLQIPGIVSIVSGFYGIPPETVKKTDTGSVSKMLANALTLVGKANEAKPKGHFIFKGEHYSVGGVMPGSDRQLTFGEYGDAVTALGKFGDIMPDFEREYGPDGYIPLMAALIAKKDAEDYDPIGRAKEFLELPLVDALGVCFFLNRQHDIYNNGSAHFLRVKGMKRAWALRVMFTFWQRLVSLISRVAHRLRRWVGSRL